MRFGVTLPAFSRFGDVRHLVRLAIAAEDAGWDGFFIWDHVIFDPTYHPMVDPWVALAAIAVQTKRIKLGAMVTPLARRRPWTVARQTVSVDLLSEGRLIFGAGLGEPAQWDFGWFHEEEDAKIRAQKLDEGLEILSGLWKGELFSYQGQHYQVEQMRFEPKPLQEPRIPIWIGGNWDKVKPQERAAKYDGYFPLKWGGQVSVEEWGDIKTKLFKHRSSDAPFDLIHGGSVPKDDPDAARKMIQDYEQVGITWWMESADPWQWGFSWEAPLPPEAADKMEERVRQGPPKV